MSLIEEYRKSKGITPRQIGDDEIVARCMYSLVNEGYKIMEEGIAENKESIDVVYVYGYGFPRQKGGKWVSLFCMLHWSILSMISIDYYTIAALFLYHSINYTILGPMFWAENEVGSQKVYTELKKYADKHPNQPWLQPCDTMANFAKTAK